MKIFVSYRRADSEESTGRIFDRLTEEFGREFVFRDVDSIPLKTKFADYLLTHIKDASVVIVVIGPDWLHAANSKGERRLDDPGDFVRTEVRTALELGIPIIPVVVRRANFPERAELPADICAMNDWNGHHVRPDPDFHSDVARLIAQIKDMSDSSIPEQRINRQSAHKSNHKPTRTPNRTLSFVRRNWNQNPWTTIAVALLIGILLNVGCIEWNCLPGNNGNAVRTNGSPLEETLTAHSWQVTQSWEVENSKNSTLWMFFSDGTFYKDKVEPGAKIQQNHLLSSYDEWHVHGFRLTIDKGRGLLTDPSSESFEIERVSETELRCVQSDGRTIVLAAVPKVKNKVFRGAKYANSFLLLLFPFVAIAITRIWRPHGSRIRFIYTWLCTTVCGGLFAGVGEGIPVDRPVSLFSGSTPELIAGCIAGAITGLIFVAPLIHVLDSGSSKSSSPTQ